MRRILLPLLALALVGDDAAAQGIRVSGTTTAQYVELQPIRSDSIAMSETTGDDFLVRTTPDGYRARCMEGGEWCRYFRNGERKSTVPLIQDLHATAWGFGEGVRVFAHLRGRGGFGASEDLWPQAERGLELLSGYVELDRESFTARAGRQWLASGLGFYNYDGGSLEYRPLRGASAELYGGLSLVRGLNQGHTGDVLAAVEDLNPDERAWLMGARLRYRPRPGMALSAFYQRELRTDRAGLYSERVAADASWSSGRTSLSGAVEADLASGEVNEARARLDLPLRGRLAGTLEARRYMPFFEMWTIWGAFSPSAFNEATAGLTWGGFTTPLSLRVRGGWRQYDETDTGVDFRPIKEDGWRFTADAGWRLSDDWSLTGDYRAEIGFGASRSEGSLGARREFGEASWLGAQAIAFQMSEEFRVQEGTVVGAGLDGGVRLLPEMRLAGSFIAYRHVGAGDEPTVDWTQRRGSLRLEWTLGRDPGVDR